MKKFYTLMAAAAVALGASAAAPQALPIGKVAAQKVVTETSFANVPLQAKSVAGMPEVVRSTKAGITVGTDINKLPGYYAATDYSLVSNGQGGAVGWEGPIQNLIDLGEAENTLDIYGYWQGTDADGAFLNKVTGNYDKAKSTLSIPAGTKVCTVNLQGGGTSDVYVYIMDLKTNKLLEDDIVYKYSAASHGFSYEATVTADGKQWATCLFFTSTPNGVGQTTDGRGFDFQVMSDLNAFNGAMSYVIKANEEGGKDDKSVDYAYYEVFDNSLLLYNVLGFGYDKFVEFTLDKEANTATLTDQSIELTTSNGNKRYYFINTSGQDMVIPFNGTTELKTSGDESLYVSYIKNDGYYFLTQDMYGFATGENIIELLDLNAFSAAGINNVAADFDENAPVEYFNLQGVRVENPANGLYIMRQGSKVAKVIL